MRSYKLRLSEPGIDLFLRCHSRVTCVTRDLVAYGTTLALAVQILARKDVQEIAADLDAVSLEGFAGDRVYHVGAITQLRLKAEAVAERLDASGLVGTSPGKQALYLVGLCQLMATEDDALLRAYRDMRGQ